MPLSFEADLFTQIRLAIALAVMLTLPGWALLVWVPDWQQWRGLQRWCLAVGISISVYPVLFYAARLAAPWLRLGMYEMLVLLLICGLTLMWKLRGRVWEQFSFDRWEWLTIGIFGATLFTRYWIIHDRPYPASPDSLHHTLLTSLTAMQGRLPFTLEPYFPIPLAMYHLGLYALSGTLQNLAQAPAHSALLWTAQALNGLCGLGIYLALDRKVGRLGACLGAVVVGLLSFQPAWLVSWGRFTPVASQTILPIAWIVTWHTLELWRQPSDRSRSALVWNTGLSALLTAAVFLLHFRVAVYYLPLLAITVAWELGVSYRQRRVKFAMLGILLVGLGALLLVSPALWEALRAYVQFAQGASGGARPPAAMEAGPSAYFDYSLNSIFTYGAHPGLLGLAALAGIVGIWRRNRVALSSVVWIVGLWLMGNAYLLNVPLLAFTNMAAVLFIWYVPISLMVGTGIEEGTQFISETYRPSARGAIVFLFLAGGVIASRSRVTEILPQNYYVMAADVAAMNWINANTPPSARFAVNTNFFSSGFEWGTDAGYWIPYFTGRKTTSGAMLFPLGDKQFIQNTLEMSRAVKRLETDSAAVAELDQWGVSYIYIGKIGNLQGGGPGLNGSQLSQAPEVTIVYQKDGVTILKINSDAPSGVYHLNTQ